MIGLVESEHLFPLLRGKDVAPFVASVPEDLVLLAPQRGMHGDRDLPRSAPHAHTYLRQFEDLLRSRSSYRRYQAKQPYWSLWSTGPYSFAPYKVVWRELSGGRFAAALVEPFDHPLLGRRTVLCDHKLYFVPFDQRDAAVFLTGLLNAPTVARAISAYAAQLSLGVTAVSYLDIPPFDPHDTRHQSIVELVDAAISNGGATDAATETLDARVMALFESGT